MDGVLPDETKWTRTIEYEENMRFDITKCHLDEINYLAKQRNLKIVVTTDERTKQVYIKVIMDNEKKIENLANYLVDLDNLLHYNGRPYSIEVEFNGNVNLKSIWIDLSKGDDERKEHTTEYYIKHIKERLQSES